MTPAALRREGTGTRRDRFDRLALALVALLFLERLVFMLVIGPGENSGGDDVAYIRSGIVFAHTGVISVWTDCPTALIMPGTTLVTGALSRLFGEGVAYLTAVKLLWMLLGSVSGWFLYRAARLYLPGGWALFAAAALLMPNRAWMDTIISTETPYTFFFLANLYVMLRLRWDRSMNSLLLYSLSFAGALLFRANIVVMPAFALLYLLLCRADGRAVLRWALTLCAVTALVLTPWAIRNYRVFDAFIPISYGAGNPTLKGTYQGSTAPSDETLDYESNVEAPIRERYAKYYDENGEFYNESYAQYVGAMTDRLKAAYRMRAWAGRDLKGFLRAYLWEKPTCMLSWIYYWGPWQAGILPFANLLSKLNFLTIVLGVPAAFLLKRKREILVFLLLIYVVNLYIIGMSYAVERYGALLMPLRYLAGAISLYLLCALPEYLRHRRQTE